MPTLVLATANPGKAADMRHLLGAALDLVPLPGDAPDVEENGATFEDNAVLKARAAARLTGLPAIGDDSGLEVDALGGGPGLRSARYAADSLPPGADRAAVDAANNLKLLSALATVPSGRRTARFHSVLAFVDGDTLLIAHGVCQGWVLEAPRGRGGFGYDPLFFCPELGMTFAEASVEDKARVSHRARAAAALAGPLATHFNIAIAKPPDSR
jgi:XTP/dITP diphosphohydrolase